LLQFLLDNPAAGLLHDNVPAMAQLGEQRRFAAARTSGDHHESFAEGAPRGCAAVCHLAAVFVLLATCATAEETKRNVGDWLVSTQGNGTSSRVIALLVKPPRAVAVQCLGHDLSIELSKPTSVGPGPMSPDATYTVQFRADQNDPINTYALGLNDTTIHVATPKRVVAQIADSNAFTFSVTSNSGSTEAWAFKAGEAKRALADVIKQCPVN
jgi:hypothetical protein